MTMLDELGSAISGYLAGKETKLGYKTIALTSLLVGILFFVFMLVKEALFDSWFSLDEFFVLLLISLSLSLFCFSFLTISMNVKKQKKGY